jgi:lipopolysaccharide export LptBFGC system permease protein LptF
VASLAKAREASKAKRQKNAYVKRIKKKEEEKAKDDIIKAQILADNSNTDKDKEIAKLKKQLESLTLQDVVKKPKPKVEKPLPTIDELNESEPPQQPSKNVEMNIDEVKPVNIPEQTENIKENHTITKEKTSQIVKARRKPRRFKGMAKYGNGRR